MLLSRLGRPLGASGARVFVSLFEACLPVFPCCVPEEMLTILAGRSAVLTLLEAIVYFETNGDMRKRENSGGKAACGGLL